MRASMKMLLAVVLCGAVSFALPAAAVDASADNEDRPTYWITSAASDNDRPVTWIAAYTGEAAWVLDGGLADVGTLAGQMYVGADVNLYKFFNWNGATLHVGMTDRHGESVSVRGIGNSTSVQEIYGGENVRLAQFTLQQRLFGGRLDLSVGREPANITFLGSEWCKYFQTNVACGNPTYVFKTSNFTWWPTSSWAAHATAWVTPEFYVMGGIYEVNPTHALNSDHGFDWSLEGSTGYIVPYAIGHKTTYENDHLPHKYEIGGWFDESDYKDPLLAANGQPALLAGLPYATHDGGRSGWFVRFEQTVWRPDDASKRSLALFGAVLGPFSGRLNESNYQMLGFYLNGPFEDRPDDSVAFLIARQEYSNLALENIAIARELAGGDGTQHRDQTMMELSYGIQFSSYVRIQPNLQYIVYPDQLNDPSRLHNLPNCVVAGLRFDVNFADAFKLND